MEKEETNFEVRHIDNSQVRQKQIDRINKMKKDRDQTACANALKKLTEAAKSKKGNLLELSIEAAKQRATLGEISYALEEVYGRHVPKDNIVRGAYSKEAQTGGDQGKKQFEEALNRVKKFSKKEGRNPRILVAKMG